MQNSKTVEVPNRPSWHEYFAQLAELVSSRSTCPRAQHGAVLVRDRRILATGYNGAPSGLPHCTDIGCDLWRLEDGGTHCKRAVHAEVNSLLQCARYGIPTEGAVLYVTGWPCIDCAQVIVQAGLSMVYITRPDALDGESRWWLQAGGVRVCALGAA